MDASLWCEPVEGSSAMTDVVVDIDQPRNDEQAFHINNFFRLPCGDVFCDGSDFPGGDSNVEKRINVVAGIDDVAALKKEIVGRCLGEVWRTEPKEGSRKNRQLR